MASAALTLADALAEDTDDDFCNALLEATPDNSSLIEWPSEEGSSILILRPAW